MQKLFARETELMHWLQSMGDELVAFDGYQGAGKSFTAKRMAELLGVPVCHLDDFVTPGQQHYHDSLDVESIFSAIDRRPVFVEGVCMCKVMRTLGISSYRLVYVNSARLLQGTALGEGPLAKEVSDYHLTFDPAAKADVIYCELRARKNCGMEQATAALDIAYINAKTRIAITLAVGGMLTLFVGLILLFFGVSTQDHTLIKFLGVEISAGGLGGVVITASAMWAFLAYKASPSYGHSTQVKERFGPDSQLLERIDVQSSTQMLIQPGKKVSSLTGL